MRLAAANTVQHVSWFSLLEGKGGVYSTSKAWPALSPLERKEINLISDRVFLNILYRVMEVHERFSHRHFQWRMSASYALWLESMPELKPPQMEKGQPAEEEKSRCIPENNKETKINRDPHIGKFMVFYFTCESSIFCLQVLKRIEDRQSNSVFSDSSW